MPATVYLETSVISYYTSRPGRDLIVAAHQQITDEWWSDVLPRCSVYISPVVLAEIGRGDAAAARARLDSVAGMQILALNEDIASLADRYYDAIAIPEAARNDAIHLALAVWHGMDYLVTWNCRHIASGRVRGIVEQLNLREGIQTPQICTPEELMEV